MKPISSPYVVLTPNDVDSGALLILDQVLSVGLQVRVKIARPELFSGKTMQSVEFWTNIPAQTHVDLLLTELMALQAFESVKLKMIIDYSQSLSAVTNVI